MQAMQASQPDEAKDKVRIKLKFCPQTSDLLYPRENRERRALEFYCKTCGHVQEAPKEEWCVWVSEQTHSEKDRTITLQDARNDPTLPRTNEVCPSCQHDCAVFYSASTEAGMTLYYTCEACGHNWRDNGARGLPDGSGYAACCLLRCRLLRCAVHVMPCAPPRRPSLLRFTPDARASLPRFWDAV